MKRVLRLLLVGLCLPAGHASAQVVPPGLCGMCAATTSNHVAGTDGSGTVIIEIHVTSTEKGHCKPKNDECKQTKSCSINFKIHTPAGSTEFHVNTAEVDAEVTDGDLDLDDWTTTDGLTTDGDGDYTAQPQTAGCGKWKHISAFAAGATVSLAKVTLQCGLCDENELPH